MKKRSFYGFLLAAVTLVATSAFLSCTDELADVKQDISVMKQDVAAHLQQQADSLKQLYDAFDEYSTKTDERLDSLENWCATNDTLVKGCIEELKFQLEQQKAACERSKDSIWNELGNVNAALILINQRLDNLTINTYTKEQVDSIINVVNSQILQTKTTLEQQIGVVKGLADAAQIAANAAQQTADQAALAAQQANQAAAQAQQTANQAAQAAQQAQQTADQAGQDAQAAAQAAQQAQQTADQAVQDAQQAALAAQAAQQTADAAKQLAEENKYSIDDLKGRVTTLENWVTEYQTKIDQVIIDANHALQLAKSDSIRLDNAEAAITEAKNLAAQADSIAKKAEQDVVNLDQATTQRIQALKDSIVNNFYDKNSIDQLFQATNDSIARVAAKFNDYYTKGEIEQKFNDYYTKSEVDQKFSDLTTAYQAADQLLKNSIDSLGQAVTSLKQDLEGQIGNLRSDLNKMITSILIQGTYNPVVGSFQLPMAGANSTILAAFHGTFTTADTNWPEDAVDSTTYAPLFNTSIMGSFPTEYFENGSTLVTDMNNGKAYAGKLYLTVNPNTVDFTGVKFDIVNSQDQVAPIKLANLKRSDEVLQFGWTRAANNGFYEAEALVNYQDLGKIKADINVGELKTIAKQALSTLKAAYKGTKNTNPLNITNAYKVIEDNIYGFLPVYGVKASWKDSQNQEHATYSQYNLAGTTLKPLSFDFYKGKSLPKIPTLKNFSYTFDFHLKSPQFGYYHVPASTINVKVYQLKAKIEGKEVTIGIYDTEAAMHTAKATWDAENPGNPAVEATMTFSTTTEDFCHKIDSLINDEIVGDVKANIDSLEQNILDQVKKNIDKVTNDINNKIVKRANKVINKLNNYLSNVNHFLQPLMIFQAQDGIWYNTSTTHTSPTKVVLKYAGEQGFLLEPTSYTAEMFAPAFRKMIAVTEVYKWDDMSVSASNGDATCKAALNLANSGIGMKEILSTRQDVLFLTDSQYKGYVYEVTYAVLDYSGKTAYTKCYLRMK